MSKTFSIQLRQIAAQLQGELVGDPDRVISGFCPLNEPEKDKIAYVAKRSLKNVASDSFGALIVPLEIELNPSEHRGNFIKVKNPYEALVSILPLFTHVRPTVASISEKAEVAPTAKIGMNVSIGAFCVIGDDVTIGDGCRIYPNVVIYEGASIGAHSIIHSGAVIREDVVLGNNAVVQNGAIIGSDGFGYVPDPELGLRAIPQVGDVVTKDRVEIGANSCIDRATLGSTRIGLGTKIDNLVQVGHNVRIGDHSLLCGMVAIAGSSNIGNQVVLGGNVGVGDHINIADKARVAAKSGVIEDLKTAGDFGGHPAIHLGTHQRNQVAGKKLAETIKELKERLPKSD